jgi:hypothetical protein
LKSAYAQLEQAALQGPPHQKRQLTPQIQSFLLLSSRIVALTDCLRAEM